MRKPDTRIATVDLHKVALRKSLDQRRVASTQVRWAAPIRSAEPLDVLGFTRHSVPVRESDSMARVEVRRLGDANHAISFQWYTTDESATAAKDYVFEFGEEQMAAGQTTATLLVPIVADSIPERPETLQVVIGVAHGARVGAAGRVPIIIVDDD